MITENAVPSRMLYSPAEVAQLLGICVAQVYVLMNKGEIASVKVRSSRRVPHGEVVAFIERLPKAS